MMIPIAQMSVSPAKLRPKPTKPQRKSQCGLTISARMAPASTSKPAPRRTWRSRDQRVFTLATTGNPASIHAFVPPSRTLNRPLAGLKQTGGHARALARLTDENDGKIEIGAEIVEPRFDLIHRNVDRAGNVAGGKFRARTHIHEQRRSGLTISQLSDGQC